MAGHIPNIANNNYKMSIVTYEKPSENVSVSDWHEYIHQICKAADIRRMDACNVRSEGRQLRNETNIATKWSDYHSNARLKERVSEVKQWRDILKGCQRSIRKEAEMLMEEKETTDRALEFAVNTPLIVVNDCMTLRNRRQGNDLNRDVVYEELKNELNVIEKSKATLSKMCLTAWEQLNRLKAEESRIQMDLENKVSAFEIDDSQLQMAQSCSNTSYKPDPLRIPNNCIPVEGWVEHSRYNKQRSDYEITESIKLREGLFCSREGAYNDLKAQHELTDFALRRRIYQMKRAKTELEWQRIKTVAEMEKLTKEIDQLDNALHSKTEVLKLAETRLENRMFRPSRELVHDPAQIQLGEQVLELRQIQVDLQLKAESIKATLTALEHHLVRIDGDVANKKHALTIDLRCVATRKWLETGDRAPHANETERNIKLNSMEEEIRSMHF